MYNTRQILSCLSDKVSDDLELGVQIVGLKSFVSIATVFRNWHLGGSQKEGHCDISEKVPRTTLRECVG